MLGWFLDGWFNELPASPSAFGRVERIVVQPQPGRFEAKDAVRVDVSEGVEGDARGPHVFVVNARALLALALGDAELAARSGDQLHVDLSLDRVNHPPGALLTIGEVILSSLGEENEPDETFTAALGRRASRRVRRHNRKGLGGRRLSFRVLSPGTIRVGDKVFPKNVGVRFQP